MGKGKGRARNPGGQVKSSEGYLNLAAVAGLSGHRDTSSCELSYMLYRVAFTEAHITDHQGPRRYYGYQEYDDLF